MNDSPQLINHGTEPPHPAHRSGLAFFSVVMAVGVDGMLQALELGTGFLAVFVSFIVGLSLIFPITLIQRYTYRDQWLLALAKGLCIAILTAIPTALPSVVTITWGVAGLASAIGKPRPPRDPDTIDMPN